MAFEFRLERRVEFAETDMAGIMHFANFFRYMEEAEHAFFRSLGLSVHMRIGDESITWPRVHAECDYKLPLKFEDRVEIHLQILERRSKALVLRFVFRRLSDRPPEEVARGALTTVCVAHDAAGGRMKAVAIPGPIAALLEPAPADSVA